MATVIGRDYTKSRMRQQAMSRLGQSLGNMFEQMAERQRMDQDLQNLGVHQQALGQAQFPGANMLMPQMQSRQMQQMQGQGLMQALMPPNQVQQAQIAASNARQASYERRGQTPQTTYSTHVTEEGDKSNLPPGTVVQQNDITGQKTILERPDPEEPLGEQLRKLVSLRRAAKGTDPGSTTSKALALAMGQDVEIAELPDVIKVIDEDIAKVLKKMRPKQTPSANVPGTNLLTAPGIPTQGPPPTRIAGDSTKTQQKDTDRRIEDEVLSKSTIPRSKVYAEAAKLKDIWGQLTEQEKVSAYSRIAIDGWTGDEVVAAFNNAR